MLPAEEGKKKRPTSQDVADRAGVSRATVSAFLNKTRYVSPGLSERISLAIQELNYTPDPLARALKLEDTRTIGLILPALSQIYTPIIQAVDALAYQNEVDLLLGSSQEDASRERRLLEMWVSKRISGILLAPCSDDNRDLLAGIGRNGTPVVQLTTRIAGLEADSVVSNHQQAVHKAVDHLVRRGRRSIAYLGYDPASFHSREKKAGYDAARRAHGLEEDLTIRVGERDATRIAAALSQFLDANRPYDGLICTTQTSTAIALRIFIERGVWIPEDVAVVGSDDTPWSSLLATPLTVVSEATYRLGEEATRLLLQRMKGGEAPPARQILLESELIVRQSA